MEPRLISPPKPTRTVLVSGPTILYNPPPHVEQKSQPIINSTGDSSLALVQDTPSNDVIDTVSVDQTNMDESITSSVDDIIDDQGTPLSTSNITVKEEHMKIKEEITSIQRQIYLSEQNLCSKTAACKQLEDDISKLVANNLDLTHQIESRQSELDQQKSQFERYYHKMTIHKAAVEEIEKASDVYKKLVEQRAMVDALKMEKQNFEANPEEVAHLLSGLYDQELRKLICDLRHELQVLEDKGVQLEKQIIETEGEEKSIQQSIEVLHKRNAAQLTRLRKRMKEVHARNRHWKDQARQLQQSIDALKEK